MHRDTWEEGKRAGAGRSGRVRAARGIWWGESRLQWPEPTRRVHLEGFLDLPVHGLEVGPRGSGVRAREAREENNLCGTADKAERCGPI